jgi:LytS/YehU family sensor histidine kinase
LRDDGRPITIELGAAREGADLKLWVRDDAHDEAVQRDLQFVRSRLEAIYGDEAHVATEATAPGGLRTVLTLPLGYA